MSTVPGRPTRSTSADSKTSTDQRAGGPRRTAVAGGRKRESRAGTRKVASLTAEQLERKRANDREAQRTIRQRTKEHIEQLERQVAELRARDEQMDNVLRRNVALEAEISRLRHQLAVVMSSRPLYPVDEGSRRSSTSSTTPSITIPSQFTGPSREGAAVPSMGPSSSRMPLSHDWQSYNSPTPSSNDVEPYVLQETSMTPAPAPVHHQPSVSPELATSHQIGFSGHLSGLGPYPQIPHPHYHAPKYEPTAQRSMSVPTVVFERGGHPGVAGGGPVTSHVQSMSELHEPQPTTMAPQGHLPLANYSWGPPPPA
ncbi:hypothetical protein VTN02DRAFT_1786 [Thermoascus thermophilus]